MDEVTIRLRTLLKWAIQLFNSEVSAGGGFNCIGFPILRLLQPSMFRPVQVYMVFRTHSAFHDVASYRPTRLAYFALSIIQA